MSLSEWMIWLQRHDSVSISALLALALFLGLYGATEWGIARRERSRLYRLNGSLELYAAAQAPLIQAAGAGAGQELSPGQAEALLTRLLACRAASYATEDMLAQIAAYAGDLDAARLPLLLKTLERESERLCKERDKLLRRAESPGWGYSLWKGIRPAIPFLFAAALLYLIAWLLRALHGDVPLAEYGAEELVNSWSWFASALLSLLLLYPALMGIYRPNAGSKLLKGWAVFIAALFLLHLLGPEVAPYILVIQVLLFLLGFRFSGGKPRKSRPFAGHYPEEDGFGQEPNERRSAAGAGDSNPPEK
ncbi:hypothetical protein [Paenibacillus haidiansis]|uniref:hypothetical protein n=1 Tax=Paenibacillus haidiansis TaxID=1574488 RepID=UPI002F9358F4